MARNENLFDLNEDDGLDAIDDVDNLDDVEELDDLDELDGLSSDIDNWREDDDFGYSERDYLSAYLR